MSNDKNELKVVAGTGKRETKAVSRKTGTPAEANQISCKDVPASPSFIERALVSVQNGEFSQSLFIQAELAVALDLSRNAITASNGNAINSSMRNIAKIIELDQKYGSQPKRLRIA